MRILFLSMLTLLVCPLLLLFSPSPTPTIPATILPTVTVTALPSSSVLEPHPEISSSVRVNRLRVGNTLTLTGVPINIGLPIYTLTLSSGASAHVRYDNQEQTIVSSDAQFEIVSMQGSMNEVTFTIRALAAGTVEATISATGEIKEANGTFMWSGGTAPTLTLTVNP